MKKNMYKIGKALAALTHHVAVKGSGKASHAGWYQRKVPEKLKK